MTSLRDLALESRHHFTLIFNSTSPLSNIVVAKFKNLHTVCFEKPTLAEKMRTLPKRIARQLGLRINTSIESPFQKAVKRENIEFLWFLTPIHHPIDIPYIATIWDIQHRVQPWFPEVGTEAEWIKREKYYSQYVQRATYIITPNHVGQDEIAFYYQIPPERFILLPHPAPEISLHEPTRIDEILKKYNLLQKGYLIYPAQLWPHKNHINLLLGLKILRDEYKISFPLVLAGSDAGNMHHILSCAKEIGIEKQICFLGFVPREDLIALYQGAFTLTYLSLFGPENLPPLEAFVCGCPVIVARVAGAEEQFADAAILVEGTKPDEIAGAINSLYTDPNLRGRLIAKGYVRAGEFTATEYVRGVFAALDRFEAVRQNWGMEYNQDTNNVAKSKK